MSSSAARPGFDQPALDAQAARDALGRLTGLWWLWLVVGIAWIAVSLIVLQFDILGFLFMLVGTWWIIEAFVERESNPVWWLGLASGLLMLILAFWTSGQFFLERAYTLLVFAGIWALMHGVSDIVRAFQLRRLRDAL
jgi:uncharacterized membrane protein HdeD (DUF308 family)